MIRGQTITVTRRRPTADTDPAGSPILKEESETVENVLVQPASQSNLTDGMRPDGIQVAYTLHFPRVYDGGSLRDALVTLEDGSTYLVVGDPRPYTGNLTPTAWDMPVEVTATEG